MVMHGAIIGVPLRLFFEDVLPRLEGEDVHEE
jgi:hypothetical protein